MADTKTKRASQVRKKQILLLSGISLGVIVIAVAGAAFCGFGAAVFTGDGVAGFSDHGDPHSSGDPGYWLSGYRKRDFSVRAVIV